MADSTADTMAANADTLRLELKKTLTEIFGDGGLSEDRGGPHRSSGVLTAIDEVIKILTCLREVESKKPSSSPDSTVANADTLKRELEKTPTEILSNGGDSKDRGETDGSFGVFKATDEAIRILTCLSEVESKKSESNVSSSSPASVPELPKEFQCTLSHAIMSEPVVIASGHTYENRYIAQWLMYKQTCPKTKEVLSHRLWTPNRLLDELITQWCRVNKYNRPKPDGSPIGLFTADIDSLLERISSPSSFKDQTEAANEVRRQTKRFANVRTFFVAEIPGSITRLVSPYADMGEAVDSNPALQKNIVTTLLNISTFEENKTAIAKHPLVIPLLTKSLKQGTDKTRRNSAEALMLLSTPDSNKVIMGSSETLKALIDAIKEGDFAVTIEAASAVCHLCVLLENREKAVSEGLIPVLTNKIKAGGKVDLLISVLAFFSQHKGAIEEMEDLGFIEYLFSILRNPSCSVTGENAVAIVYNMCGLNTGDRNREKARVKVVDEEETQYGTFTKLAKQGSSDRAVEKAEAILQWLKRFGTGDEPESG